MEAATYMHLAILAPATRCSPGGERCRSASAFFAFHFLPSAYFHVNFYYNWCHIPAETTREMPGLTHFKRIVTADCPDRSKYSGALQVHVHIWDHAIRRALARAVIGANKYQTSPSPELELDLHQMTF